MEWNYRLSQKNVRLWEGLHETACSLTQRFFHELGSSINMIYGHFFWDTWYLYYQIDNYHFLRIRKIKISVWDSEPYQVMRSNIYHCFVNPKTKTNCFDWHWAHHRSHQHLNTGTDSDSDESLDYYNHANDVNKNDTRNNRTSARYQHANYDDDEPRYMDHVTVNGSLNNHQDRFENEVFTREQYNGERNNRNRGVDEFRLHQHEFRFFITHQ